VIFLGRPGVGKTDLANGLAVATAESGGLADCDALPDPSPGPGATRRPRSSPAVPGSRHRARATELSTATAL